MMQKDVSPFTVKMTSDNIEILKQYYSDTAKFEPQVCILNIKLLSDFLSAAVLGSDLI